MMVWPDGFSFYNFFVFGFLIFGFSCSNFLVFGFSFFGFSLYNFLVFGFSFLAPTIDQQGLSAWLEHPTRSRRVVGSNPI